MSNKHAVCHIHWNGGMPHVINRKKVYVKEFSSDKDAVA